MQFHVWKKKKNYLHVCTFQTERCSPPSWPCCKNKLEIGVYEGPTYLHLRACPVRERHVVPSRKAQKQTRSKENKGRGRNEYASLDPIFTKSIRFSGKMLNVTLKTVKVYEVSYHIKVVSLPFHMDPGLPSITPELLHLTRTYSEFFQLKLGNLSIGVSLPMLGEKLKAILHEIKMVTL